MNMFVQQHFINRNYKKTWSRCNKKMEKNLIISGLLTMFILSLLLVVSPVKAAEDDAGIQVIVITDGDVNASLDATAGGNVTFWIDGIEVKSEFEDIWTYINNIDQHVAVTTLDTNSELTSLKKYIEDVEGTANGAWEYANNAFAYAGNAYSYADKNNDSIVYLFTWASNIEASYLENVTKFDGLIEKIQEDLDDHEKRIVLLELDLNKLQEKIALLESETEDLDNRLNDLNETVALQDETINSLKSDLNGLKNGLMGIGAVILIVAIAVVLLFLINRKYPLGYIIRNGKEVIVNGKQKITGYVKRADKSKTKAFWSKVKHTKIKRNPDRSPVKLFFSFLQIQK